MNEITYWLDVWLFAIDITEPIVLLGVFITAFLAKTYIKNQAEGIPEIYDLLIPKDLKFISKKVKKINLILFLKFSIIWVLVSWIFPIMLFLISRLSIDPNIFKQKIDFSKIYYHFIIIISITISFFSILSFLFIFFYKKQNSYETSDEKLLKNFADFKNEWINKHGKEKIIFKTNSFKKLINFSFKTNQKNLIKLNKLPQKFPKNYQFIYIEKFRNYLWWANKSIISLLDTCNGSVIATLENDQSVSAEELKFLIIHNLVCAIDESEKLIQKNVQ